jgi:ABC-type oligopeptide transport system substrate-binding subunit
MGSYRKLDPMTVAITMTTPASYFPYMAVYILFTSPTSFDKAGRDWGKVATLPPTGTGPFRLESVVSRQSVTACAERRLLEPGAQGQGRESAAADAGGK